MDSNNEIVFIVFKSSFKTFCLKYKKKEDENKG